MIAGQQPVEVARASLTRGRHNLDRGRRQLARWLTPPSRESAFYPQQPTCQIADMWFLLEHYLGRDPGTFVEIGAFDGVSFSNTWGLAERGWRGLLVEPVAHYASRARKAHAGHPNVIVVECAVGARAGTVEIFTARQLSTANLAVRTQYGSLDWSSGYLDGNSVRVPMVTLDRLLAEHLVDQPPDVIVVDVEGFEADVFAGFSWRDRPAMLVVELTDTHPDLNATRSSDATLQRMIVGHGYEVVFKDRINTIFVRDDVWEARSLS